ncbi:hypothetical protein BURCENBC7_AP4792 [Burkholderia cenocepacia BC7]|nr:hypothetical protein BURCENK562V_C0452 [Burkholderia cenocepacia K56-2Valvano]ERI31609.1 hypothetical protein BURCENBC7_AP4792 [Burkholderia cenocepacia BC7]
MRQAPRTCCSCDPDVHHDRTRIEYDHFVEMIREAGNPSSLVG